jgi:DNA polymerase I
VPEVKPPAAPRLFLIDGYALIYRAFFALISRPLTSSRGENTSAAFGIATFLRRLITKHQPEYLGWVHDSGLSHRHERFPAYKATRQKLTDELQDDFNRGMERIKQILDAYRIQVKICEGYEADDVIGTLASKAVDQGVNIVIVSGDKDFQQLVRPGVWLLNPGRGGPAAVDESWVGMENASDRLGVAPRFVTDYLSMVGDSSDNVPGVKGIGDKTAKELVETYGTIEEILAHVDEITKKRPREALIEHSGNALLSKELVTIREDVPVELELEKMRLVEPDYDRLVPLLVELEFHVLARDVATDRATAAPSITTDTTASDDRAPAPAIERRYETVDTIEALDRLVERANDASFIALDLETVPEPGSPLPGDPMRSRLISMSIALAPGEAYYLPLAHRDVASADAEQAEQGELLIDASGDRAPTDAREDLGLVLGGDEAAPTPKPAAKKKASKVPEPTSIAARALANRPRPVRNLPPLSSAEMQPLVALLEDPFVRKTVQNVKHDVLVLRNVGVRLDGVDFDTMLASYVLDPGRRSHGLDVLALEFLDHKMTSFEELCGKGKTAVPFDQCPIDCARDYSCEDADMTLRLRERFEPQLAQYELTELFRDVEMRLIDVLADMEFTGISIDLPWFASLKERFTKERQAVEKEIYSVAGREFNINSNPQLREILFDELKLPVLKKTPTGPSTDASVLTQLAEEGHALPTLLMEYRELSKLESTYLDTLPALVHPRTGRLHTSYSQTVAATGRLSSSDPNLQNIPIRRELGRDIRRGFIPRKGWQLLSADYSQIELRLLAHLSQDPAFVAAFKAGGDIHRQTASVIFGVPVELVSSEMRARAKTINFATIYGQGAHALGLQLKIEHAEAKQFIATYFERFVGVRNYLDSMVAFARENGYAKTLFGRRRYIPELRERNFNIRAFGERVATNSPIQGSAADLIKIAMLRVYNALQVEELSAKMLLQVHDELVFEAPPNEVEQVQALIRREMEGAAELSVPLVVDIGVGDNWVAAK